jgi:NAD(P)-dependent dehydrogenase (short-subunit alcohol dehydrogenase family)
MRIEGSVALVTGSGSGLGEATARHLHGLGAHVVLFDISEDRIRALASQLGERVDFCAGDATDEAATRRVVEQATAIGDLRIAVACAGGGAQGQRLVKRDGSPHELGLFMDTMQLNVVSTFNTMRFAGAAMSQLDPDNDDGERGTMVITSSLAGYEGQIGTIAYSAAKAAIIGMTLVGARDLAASGIRVNCIAPGTMDTTAWSQADPAVKAALESKVPFPRRFGRVEEFADLVAHLVTNRYINGHVVRLDGAIRFDPK